MTRIIEKLLKTNRQSNLLSDVLTTIPRIVCGLLLGFSFGGSKFGGPWSSSDLPLFGIPEWFPEDVAAFGGIFTLAPYFFAWMAAASETIGGFLLALGLKTRLVSFLIMCTMLVAIFLQQWDNGLWGMLPATGFLWVSLHSLVHGSGRFGLDYLIIKNFHKRKLINTPISQINISSARTLMITLFSSTLLLLNCSSAAQERIVNISVDMNGLKKVSEVGIKGSIKPLSWDKEFPLSDENKDGIYEATLNFNTSDRYLRFKFTVDGEEELEGSDQRVLWLKEESISKTYTFNEFEYYTKEEIESLTYTEEQIGEEVAVLKEIIQYVHPAIYVFQDSVELQMDFDELEKEMLNQPNLIGVYKAVSRFAAKVKCSHTFTNPWNQGPDIKKASFYQPDKLPFTFSRIGKRLFIDKNASESSALNRGDEIISINGIATKTVLETLAQYVTSDGNNYEKKLERLSLNGSEKYSLFDIFYPLEFGSADQFTLELKDAKTKQVFSSTVNATSKTNRTKVLKERYGKLELSVRDGWNFEIIDNKTAILTVKSFVIFRDEFDWKKVLDQYFEELHRNKTPNLIIDIRENEGGQGEVGEYILEKIIQDPFEAPAMRASVSYLTIPDKFKNYMGTWAKDPYDFSYGYDRVENRKYVLKDKYSVAAKTYKPKKNGYKGNVYLLIGATNSSATHLMASYAKQIEGITLVGQETGGNQLGTNGGFIFFLRLPNSRVEIDIPVINQFVPPLSGEAIDAGIKPDIYVEKNWEDLVNGVDTEIEATLNLINQ